MCSGHVMVNSEPFEADTGLRTGFVGPIGFALITVRAFIQKPFRSGQDP